MSGFMTTDPAVDPAVLPAIEVPKEDPTTPLVVALDPSPDVNVPPRPRRPYLDLFLISFLILFFELAAIRWFGSTVVFLTFFTNIVLLATFLGMSVGLMTASRRANFQRWVLPLGFITIALAFATFWAYHHYADKLTIDVGGQTSAPKFIYFGTEYRPNDPSRFIIPLWAVAGLFFTLIAITFVGLGQTMGRAFDAIPNRVLAYTVDVLGSLTGITLFGLMSWFHLSPQFWFVVAIALGLYFIRQRLNLFQVLCAMGAMFIIAMSAYGVGHRGQVFWSPYYKIAHNIRTGFIDTNNISHQEMVKIWENGSRYALPHLLNRDAGNAPFKDVLVIGAGSGNDVAAALLNGAEKIDAVEIDPMINQIGRWDHPDKPYDDKRVTVHLDDGRSFVRRPENKKKYDLAVYALVDSLVLHSGYSSLRLENFLFTKEALQDVKSTLKPGGVFAMYNYFRFGWVAGRLDQMVEQVFGAKPVVVTLAPPGTPPRTTIGPNDNQKDVITFMLVGADSQKVEAIKKKFETDKTFWSNFKPSENLYVNGFRELPPDDGQWWRPVQPSTVITAQPADIASRSPEERRAYAALTLLPNDNWPQLYLQSKAIPWKPNGQGMVVVAAMSVLILIGFTFPVWFGKNRRGGRPNGQMFFLGAGFMLLETKGVVHMALLFGSTWVVNSVVFFAILVMILLSNLFVMIVKPRNLLPYYALLAVALLVNALVPMDVFLSLSSTARTITSCAVVFVPVFFAGVIFATSFRESRNPDVDFGSNVAGIILGGLSEQLSLIIGFNYLLLVAIGYYLLSWVLKRRGSGEAMPQSNSPAHAPG
jgi:spermidine synthase